jgi:UDP-N-acetylglucosamine 4,6-dehydratase
MDRIIRSLTDLSRQRKKFIVRSIDLLSILIAIFIAFLSSGIVFQELNISHILGIFSIPFFSLLIFNFLGIYHSVLRYIDFSFIYLLVGGILASLLFSLLIIFLFSYFLDSSFNQEFNFENKVSFLGWSVGSLSSAILIIGTRLLANYLFRIRYVHKRVVIYGAGSAGIQLASALRVSNEIKPVAFLDSNKSLHGTYLGGMKILHPKKLEKLVLKGKVDEVLIAIPSASKSILRSLLKEIEGYSLKVRILPGLAELAQGKILVSELKEVDISDLLGRYEVEANQSLINKNIQNKVVLITGAGGSIGSEISRQVTKNKASKIILLDANEYALYSIKNEIESYETHGNIYAVLANVNNKKRIREVCEAFKVDTIYHAAAYKHVPLVEENPFEAVFNNIQGTKVCAEAAIEAEVETFVLISTDKAVRPTNIMGATKRFSEMILQSLAANSYTKMTMVRFGNVIGSSGSAIPLFQQQIKEGGPVTVTHPEVIRYFMSIPEAAELVIQAGAMGKGGDVFVLDMGEPVRIYDLAKRLINLSGMEVKDDDNPEGDIEIIFTGLRPGEKLYEELLIGDKVSTTEHKQILRAEEDFLPVKELQIYLDTLQEAEKEGDVALLRDILRKVISGFTPAEEIVDVVYKQKN